MDPKEPEAGFFEILPRGGGLCELALKIAEAGLDYLRLRDDSTDVRISFADDEMFSKEDSAAFCVTSSREIGYGAKISLSRMSDGIWSSVCSAEMA